MAWQSSTINPSTTSPAADITKLTNDLQVLRTVLGGGTDADVPLTPSSIIAGASTQVFGTGGAERMRIDPAGRVGIGTGSNLNLRLTVSDGANRTEFSPGVIQALNEARTATTELQTYGSLQTFWTGAAGGQAERMRIDASGNVGIGTSSPSTYGRFAVVGGAFDFYVNPGAAGVRTEIGSVGANPLAVYVGGAERMRIDASGNVGIGTSSPSAPLTVANSNPEITSFIRNVDVASVGAAGVTMGFSALVGTTSTRAAQLTATLLTATTGQLSLSTRDASLGVTECVRLGSAGEVFFTRVGTTASAANAFINNASSPANQLLRSTSSLRYKKDVEAIESARVDAAITGLRPIWYRSKAEADNKTWSWYGLIAEEVAEVEPRLVHWSYTNDAYEDVEVEKDGETRTERRLKDGAQLVPDGVQYERLAVLLLAEVQALRARVAALEAA